MRSLFLISCAVASLFACQTRQFASPKSTDPMEKFEFAQKRSERMRSLFHAYFKAEKSTVSENDTKSLFYLRNEKQNFADLQSNIRHPDKGQSRFLNTFFRSLKPSELYEFGKNIPLQKINEVSESLKETGPITYVLFPGITVEFSFSKPYHEILANQKSSFSLLSKEFIQNSSQSLIADMQYKLDSLAEVQAPIDDYMDFASVDDVNGKPLAQFIYLKPKLGSLETLGYNTDNAKTYVRRLDKTFEMFEKANYELKNVVFIGYSRGVTAGLTTLSDLNQRQKTSEKKKWVANIKGFVSVAGVAYGNELADSYAADSTNPNYVMLQKIDSLAQKLKEQESGVQPFSRTRTLAENSKSWLEMIKSIPSLPPAETYEGLQAEKIEMGMPNVVSLFGFFRNVMFDVFKPTEYFRDVQRFKVFNTKLKQGLESCMRSTMRTWWSTSDLPSNIKYYNFLATQGDPTEPKSKPWIFTKNPLAYGTRSLDFPVNRSSYYEILRLTGADRKSLNGEAINDGAVEASAGYLHNGFIRAMNSKQELLDISFLGYLGTHHWGTVMPFGIQSVGEGGKNPFPRTAFISALSEFIASDLLLK